MFLPRRLRCGFRPLSITLASPWIGLREKIEDSAQVRAASRNWLVNERDIRSSRTTNTNNKIKTQATMKLQIRTLLVLAFGAATLLTTGTSASGLTLVPPTIPGRLTNPQLITPRPTLVVLIHGGTSDPNGSDSPNIFEDGHAPNTLAYSRFYFDFPFASAALGVPTFGSLFTTSGVRLTKSNWSTAAVSETDVNNFFAVASQLPSAAARRTITGIGFVHANGASRLGDHSRQVLGQIMTLYSSFATWTGGDPYIVLVGHSKGGMVARYLMSAPTGRVANVDLSPDEETNCRFLRDKCKYIVTLGTPHDGSPLAEAGLDILHKLNDTGAAFQNFWNATRTTLRTVGVNMPATPPLNLDGVRAIIGSEAELTDLTSDATVGFNTGELKPTQMKRSDGSPIPMYCYAGRSPGDRFFATPRHDGSGGPSLAELNTTEGKAAMGLCTLDWALHNIAERDWGTLTTLGTGKSLDLVRRTYSITEIHPQALPPFFNITKRFSNPFEAFEIPFTDFAFEGMPIYFQRNSHDSETDSDGMVPASSALAVTLSVIGTEPYDHTQQGGQIYRMYGTGASPWAFCNHRTLSNSKPMGDEVHRLLISAGPKVSTGSMSTF